MPFGQIVIGPPGSGKTTYCYGMQQYMVALGRRACVVNLDPANDSLPYEAAVDIADLVHLDTVMEELQLGPNGGMVYCIEFLRNNLDWLQEKLAPLEKDDTYVILDCPGQVELFMLHDSLRTVLDTMTGKWSYRMTVVHLVDAHLCTEPTKYISALLLSLSTMLHLEQPHVNVLSKMDLIRQYGKLDFSLDYYTEVQDLSYLVRAIGSGNDVFSKRYRKLSQGLCEIVQDFGLLSFVPLAVQDMSSMQRLLVHIDRANGYVYASLAGKSPYPPELVYGASAPDVADSDIYLSLQEKYVAGNVRERKSNAFAVATSAPPVVETCGHAAAEDPAAAKSVALESSQQHTDAGAGTTTSTTVMGSYIVNDDERSRRTTSSACMLGQGM